MGVSSCLLLFPFPSLYLISQCVHSCLFSSFPFRVFSSSFQFLRLKSICGLKTISRKYRSHQYKTQCKHIFEIIYIPQFFFFGPYTLITTQLFCIKFLMDHQNFQSLRRQHIFFPNNHISILKICNNCMFSLQRSRNLDMFGPGKDPR